MADQGKSHTARGITTFSGRISKPPERYGYPSGEVAMGRSELREPSQAPITSTPQDNQAHRGLIGKGPDESFIGRSFQERRSPPASVKSLSSRASSAARMAKLARDREMLAKKSALEKEQMQLEIERMQLKMKESSLMERSQLHKIDEEMAAIEDEEGSQYFGSESGSVHSFDGDHHGEDRKLPNLLKSDKYKDKVDLVEHPSKSILGIDTLGHALSTFARGSVEAVQDEFQDKLEEQHHDYEGKLLPSVVARDLSKPEADSYVFKDPFAEITAKSLGLGKGSGGTAGAIATGFTPQPVYPAGAVSTGEWLFSGAIPRVPPIPQKPPDKDTETRPSITSQNIRDHVRSGQAKLGEIFSTAKEVGSCYHGLLDRTSFPSSIQKKNSGVQAWSDPYFTRTEVAYQKPEEKQSVYVEDRVTFGKRVTELGFDHDKRSVPPGLRTSFANPSEGVQASSDPKISFEPQSRSQNPQLLQAPKNKASDRAKEMFMTGRNQPHVSIHTIPNSSTTETQAYRGWLGNSSESDAAAAQGGFCKWTKSSQDGPKPTYGLSAGPARAEAISIPPPVRTQAQPPLAEQQNVSSTSMDRIIYVLEQLVALQANTQAGEMRQSRESATESEIRMLMARQTSLKELPVYSGEAEGWVQFQATYERTSQQCRFSNAENLARLQKCLRGPAKEAVSSLMVSPANLPRIIESLAEQFGQPRIIVAKLAEKARSVAPVKEDKLETWMTFTGAVRSLVAAMSSLDCKTHMSNPMLIDELVSKLPMSYQTEFARFNVQLQRDPDMEDLERWLTDQTKVVSKLRLCPKIPESKPQPSKPKDSTKPSKKPTETLLAVSENEKDEPTKSKPSGSESKTSNKKCHYCEKDGHWTLRCPEMKEDNVNTRNSKIQQKRLCWGCFSNQHRINDCKHKRKCGIDGCEKLHNKVLHRPPSHNQSGSTEEKKSDSEQVTAVGDQRKRRVLLRLAPILIRGPKGSTTVFALFDEGSSCSLLEQSVADQLGIKGFKDPLKMSFANGLTTEDLSSERVQFQVADPQKTNFFKVSRVRTIKGLKLAAQSVNVPQIRKSWAHILDKGVESYADIRPQLILGQDNYKLIAPRTIIEGPANAPVMTETLLGWIIHGNLSTIKNRSDSEFVYAQVLEPSSDDLHQLVQDYFAVEALGVKVTPTRISAEEKSVRDPEQYHF